MASSAHVWAAIQGGNSLMNEQVWITLRLAVLVSPFWFLAAKIDDGDELVKTLTGLSMLAAVNFAPKLKHLSTGKSKGTTK